MGSHITPDLLELISSGEDVNVEFKKSKSEIPSSVYGAVCAFSNREGGHIFLGIDDNGNIFGLEKDKIN